MLPGLFSLLYQCLAAERWSDGSTEPELVGRNREEKQGRGELETERRTV